jgi:hypothetical protein
VLAAAPLIGALEQIAPNLALNRFGCRVVQRLVQVLSPERVRLLLIHRFKGIELQLVTDQNGIKLKTCHSFFQSYNIR